MSNTVLGIFYSVISLNSTTPLSCKFVGATPATAECILNSTGNELTQTLMCYRDTMREVAVCECGTYGSFRKLKKLPPWVPRPAVAQFL